MGELPNSGRKKVAEIVINGDYMRTDVPFIAFSLSPDDEALHTTMLDRRALERNKPAFKDTLSTLESLNDRGADEAASLIGKWVLLMLNNSYPDKFAPYPNLVIPVRPISPERKAAILAEAGADGKGKDDKA